MRVPLLKSFHENFALRVFIVFAVLLSLMSFSFIALCIHQERGTLRTAVINRGRLLAGILAHSARIGVFSENQKLLEEPLESILGQEDVLDAAVFNLKGDLLKGRQKGNSPESGGSADTNGKSGHRTSDAAAMPVSPYFLEHRNSFQFWSPVTSSPRYSQETSFFMGEDLLKKKDQIIGSVRVTFSKTMLNEKLQSLLLRSIVVGITFLIIGFGFTYLVVRRTTRPLNKLTEGVKALGRGGVPEKISVEARDEIGKLAKAFNDMSESLKKREDALRHSEQRLRSLSSQLMEAQEQERSRLSKELHDELGQSLALLKHRVRSIERKLAGDQSVLREECEETNRYIDDIIENVRRLSRDLSPSILEDLGLSSALRWLTENVAGRYGLEASLDIEDIDHLISKEARANLYRIFQEALTNIGKHSKARHVCCLAKKNGTTVSFVIEDDGIGFDVNEVKASRFPKRGLGLEAMAERALIIGAFLDIGSKTGEGTRITLKIPIQEGGILL